MCACILVCSTGSQSFWMLFIIISCSHRSTIIMFTVKRYFNRQIKCWDSSVWYNFGLEQGCYYWTLSYSLCFLYVQGVICLYVDNPVSEASWDGATLLSPTCIILYRHTVFIFCPTIAYKGRKYRWQKTSTSDKIKTKLHGQGCYFVD